MLGRYRKTESPDKGIRGAGRENVKWNKLGYLTVSVDDKR